MSRYADVVVPRQLHRVFTYTIPPPLQAILSVGDAVMVPFGSVTVRAVVVALPTTLGADQATTRLRSILSVCRDGPASALDRRLFDLARWIADYYLTPLGPCLRLVLPPVAVGTRQERFVLTAAGRACLAAASPEAAELAPLLQALEPRPKGASLTWLEKQGAAFSRAGLTHAIECGWVAAEGPKRRAPSHSTDAQDADIAGPELASSLREARARWEATLTTQMTPVGRGRLLIEAMPDERLGAMLAAVTCAMAAGRRCLIISPELRRVQVIASVLRAQWGDAVVLWGGERTPKARLAAWEHVRAGGVRIVVGTRTTVFAPVDEVGLVCLEEPDHAALKDEQMPRFHAHHVAWQRAQVDGADLLVLAGQASLETRSRFPAPHTASSDSAPALVSADPPVEIVSLEYVSRETPLTPTLLTAMTETLARAQPVALYLNRRGFAPALVCTSCQAVPQCPRCQVALTFSQASRRVRCRVCGVQSPAPEQCHSCRGVQFDMAGYGTERLEQELARLFPQARLRRWDRDTVARPGGRLSRKQPLPSGSHQDRDWDIALGTALLARELPPRSCALVGIVYADAGLHVPDFRAAERAYRDLWDVMQLADPAVGGRAILQTRLPDHAVMRALATGQRELLDREERSMREALGYPPFGSMVALEVVGQQDARVRDVADRWGNLLRALAASQSKGASTSGRQAAPLLDAQAVLTVLGPVPLSPGGSRGVARARLLAKGRDGEIVRRLIRHTMLQMSEAAARQRVKLIVDVDPVELD